MRKDSATFILSKLLIRSRSYHPLWLRNGPFWPSRYLNETRLSGLLGGFVWGFEEF